MGTIDRIARIVIAIVLVILIIVGTINGVWAIVLGIIAAVFIVTTAIGYCPLYAALGIHTLRCRVGNDD